MLTQASLSQTFSSFSRIRPRMAKSQELVSANIAGVWTQIWEMLYDILSVCLQLWGYLWQGLTRSTSLGLVSRLTRVWAKGHNTHHAHRGPSLFVLLTCLKWTNKHWTTFCKNLSLIKHSIIQLMWYINCCFRFLSLIFNHSHPLYYFLNFVFSKGVAYIIHMRALTNMVATKGLLQPLSFF